MCHGRKVSYTVEVQSLAGHYITLLYTRECIIMVRTSTESKYKILILRITHYVCEAAAAWLRLIIVCARADRMEATGSLQAQ